MCAMLCADALIGQTISQPGVRRANPTRTSNDDDRNRRAHAEVGANGVDNRDEHIEHNSTRGRTDDAMTNYFYKAWYSSAAKRTLSLN